MVRLRDPSSVFQHRALGRVGVVGGVGADGRRLLRRDLVAIGYQNRTARQSGLLPSDADYLRRSLARSRADIGARARTTLYRQPGRATADLGGGAGHAGCALRKGIADAWDSRWEF